MHRRRWTRLGSRNLARLFLTGLQTRRDAHAIIPSAHSQTRKVAERHFYHGRRLVSSSKARHDAVGADGGRQASRGDEADQHACVERLVSGALDPRRDTRDGRGYDETGR